MSLMYDKYIEQHKKCVEIACDWLLTKISDEVLNDIFPNLNEFILDRNIRDHDMSKLSIKEYDAYDKYFYSEKTDQVKKDFDYAWLHHLHCNPHHWQYWILKEDDGPVLQNNQMTVKTLEIPDNYIIEMISDWWSFSWKSYMASHNKEDLYEIFNWYNDHKDRMVIHQNSKVKIEKILNEIKNKLDDQKDSIEILSERMI